MYFIAIFKPLLLPPPSLFSPSSSFSPSPPPTLSLPLTYQLIESLVKARKTENSDEMIFSRPDQRRPEAVIREMKAKARSLMAKINGRMEATKQNGG